MKFSSALAALDFEVAATMHEEQVGREHSDVRVPGEDLIHDTDTDADTDTEIHESMGGLRGGGLASPKVFLWSELIQYLPEAAGEVPPLDAALYELLKYTSMNAMGEVLIDNPDAFPLLVPLSLILTQMNVAEMKSLARLHGVYIARQDNKAGLSEKLIEHVCISDECKSYVAVFVPSRASQDLISMTYRPEYMDKVFAGIKPFALDDFLMLVDIPATLHPLYIHGAKISGLQEIGNGLVSDAIVDGAVVCDPVPWMNLAHKGTKYAVHFLAKLHGIPLLSKATRQDALDALGKHVCIGCKRFRAIFQPVIIKPYCRSRRDIKRSAVRSDDRDPYASGSGSESETEVSSGLGKTGEGMVGGRRPFTIHPPAKDTHPYPPTPLTVEEKMGVIQEFCDDLHPSKFEEAGCMVCGQLSLLAELISAQAMEYSLAPLVEPGLVRRERLSTAHALEYEQGPIIDKACRGVCRKCHRSLKQGKRPRNALANGLWVGTVPPQLLGLTYAEQCLVARVRSNRCVVRVSMGQAKMMANAVSFACPTLKVYKKLPPARHDLDEVLAFIFTGIQPPNENDLERTPMLVRRNKVGCALEWLKLNHVDYQDLNIDYETLAAYPESGIPVDVIFRQTDVDSNVIAAATSVHEGNDDEGASVGPCPLKVNGLIAENLETMSFDARRAAAVHHLQTGGHVLAVGHSEYPESMYENPQLYPQMYPWLFPYGAGGLGNARVKGLVSERRQKRWMLLYHDKRFQEDSRFILITFNHEQIKTCVTSSYILAKRRNFASLASKVSNVNPAVVMNITNRLLEGEKVIPVTDDEKLCFSLMDQIEHVGVTVPGTMAGRKAMRTNLWSMMTCQGSPSWFITMSPVDINHPLCIYWARHDIEFRPTLRSKNDRIRLIAQNPVAGARFFHYMVQLFIKHLLRWRDGEGRPGIFGQTGGYFGTVEQQGRMTLHLHMLIWVSCSLSPSEIRERLLSDESEFRRDLIAYLESCQIGEFMTGTMLEMDEKHADVRPRGAWRRGDEIDPNDPTQRMPVRPPEVLCPRRSSEDCPCDECGEYRVWLRRYKPRVDHLMYVSNKHTCQRVGEAPAGGGTHKVRSIAKGCINKDGVCSARFPRETFEETVVDEKGRISLKKLESRLNTVNDIMVYCFCCNTDCTCLTSGTAVNATVGYVADYIVKMGLKTHQIFSSIYDVFEKNVDIWSQSQTKGDAARKLILKMANSLTSKMEIGAPMAAMYLLGHPDNYCSQSFVPLYWKQFHTEVVSVWESAIDSYNENAEPVVHQITASFSGASPFEIAVEQDGTGIEGDKDPGWVDNDTVTVSRSGNHLISKSSVDDYKLRPVELDSVCVYDWVQCGSRVRLNSRLRNEICLLYTEGHPLRDTHGITFDASRMLTVVPSIMGPNLPRKSNEDQREFYACVMLALFAPWRSGLDLKSSDETWAEAFDRHCFSARHQTLIRNANLRYECYDARDDYHAQMRQKAAALAEGADDEDHPLDEGPDAPDDDNVPQDLLDDDALGVWSKKRKGQMSEVEAVLQSAGWVSDSSLGLNRRSDILFNPERMLTPAMWKDLVVTAREGVLAARRKGIPNTIHLEDDMDIAECVINDARIIKGSYLSADFKVSDVELVALKDEVVSYYKLNTEQRRAFTIIANHSMSIHPPPLRMYIGGMGGTGKTTVIKALRLWFERKGQAYRMGVLAPTGAAAAIVSGSTYHSFLGVRTGERRTGGPQNSGALEDARVRMYGMDYIFLDEISMVSCQDLYLIDSRLKDIAKVYDIPFGKVNIIFAGDFAQLPPAQGFALYSGEVSRFQVSRQTKNDQENTLGLLIWHQFTTVVLLTQNMRQTSDEHPDEAKLRDALIRMRYKDCTPDDIEFLQSRVPMFNPRLSLQDPRWRDVSVITAWNTHKDQINTMNAKRFALEHNEELHYFYSIDRQTQRYSKGKGRKSTRRTSSRSLTLTSTIQEALWNSPPYTSDHFAGCLMLCKGMPVMIRHNDATELCITKGQEAIVKGWTCHEMATYPGKFVLDVLFVELLIPPEKTVQLPYLPKNVVPLMKLSDAISAVLPNDRTIHVTRQQVPVLPNFAMTDYASQGKTRTVNVVDVKHCKNHQAMYTALSRGTSAVDTLIVREFSVKKITGGLSGYLRQEFRDLETLNEITRLQYNGKLPMGIVQRLRDSTLRAYRGWKDNGSAPEVVPTSGAKRRIDTLENPVLQYPPTKRSRVISSVTQSSSPLISRSWEWDSVNWSCAYDAYLSIILFIWNRDPTRWANALRWYGVHMSAFVNELLKYRVGGVPLVAVRQRVRNAMWALSSDEFPRGQVGTDVYALARTMSGYPIIETMQAKPRKCWECGQEEPGELFESIDYISGLEKKVSSCSRCGCDLYLPNESPPLICLQLPQPDSVDSIPLISSTIKIQERSYSLAGVVYWSSRDFHFASRLVDSTGHVLRYDSMLHKGSFVVETDLAAAFLGGGAALRMLDHRLASLAIYCQDAKPIPHMSRPPTARHR